MIMKDLDKSYDNKKRSKVLFGAVGKNKNKVKSGNSKKRKRDENDNDSMPVSKKSKKEINSDIILGKLSYENISEGQVVLGCVEDVAEFEIVISLPHRMTGTVNIQHISDSYKDLLVKVAQNEDDIEDEVCSLKDLFPIGHYVIVKVVSIVTIENEDESKTIKISLSMLPKDVNESARVTTLVEGSLLQCAVKSVEETGYVMDTGFASVRSGFLSKKRLPFHLETLGIGSVLMCSVHSVSIDEDTQYATLKLSAKSKMIYANVFPVDPKTNIMTLLPGTLLEMDVMEVCQEGVVLSSQHIQGVAHVHHLSKPFQNTIDYFSGQKVLARILYIANVTHDIYFTLNEEICSGSPSSEHLNGLNVNDIIEEAKIIKLNEQGCCLELPNGSFGFCSLRHMSKTPMELKALKGKFKVGSTNACKISRFNFIDELFIVSFKKSSDYVQISLKKDLEIGQVVKVKILAYVKGGAQVSFGNNVAGFIPLRHLSDSSMLEVKKKYPVHYKGMGRILNLSPDTTDFPLLTLKTALVTSDAEVIKDFSSDNVDKIAHGYINKIYDHGLMVSFFESAYGFVPAARLPLKVDQVPGDIYSIDQVVPVKVMKCDPDKKQMLLTMELDETKRDLKNKTVKKEKVKKKTVKKSSKRSQTSNDLKVGQVVELLRITAVKKSYVKVIHKATLCRGQIDVEHFSDDLDQSHAIFNSLAVGKSIKNAVIILETEDGFKFSLKPSFYHYARKDSVFNNDALPSFVSEIKDKTLSLTVLKGNNVIDHKSTPNNILLPFRDLKKKIKVAGLAVGSTLIVKPMKSNSDRIYELRAWFDNFKCDVELASLQYLLDYINVYRPLKQRFECNELADVVIGSRHKVKVLDMNKFGLFVHLEELNLDGVISKNHVEDVKKVTIHKYIDAQVLYVNFIEQCVELTANNNTVLKSTSDHGLEIGQKGTCEILICRSNFILGKLTDLSVNQLVYLPDKRHWNDLKGRHCFYEVGKTVQVTIRYIEDDIVLVDLSVHCGDDVKNVELSSNIPVVEFSKLKKPKTKALSISQDVYTESDLRKRMHKKIEKIVEPINKKRSAKDTSTYDQKLAILELDDFLPYNDDTYWNEVLEKRAIKKKLKKKGLSSSSKPKAKKVVSSKAKKVETNSKKVKSTSKKVKTNDMKVETNSKKVKSTSKKVKTNDMKVETNSKKVKSTSKKVKTNDMKVETNSKKVKSTSKKVKTNDKKVESTSKKVKSTSKQVKTNDKKVKSNSKKVKESMQNQIEDSSFMEVDDSSSDVSLDQIYDTEHFSSDSESSDDQDNEMSEATKEAICLELKSGFNWTEDPKTEQVDDSSSDDDEESNSNQRGIKKLTKEERRQMMIEKERRVRELEIQRGDSNRLPETAVDFEELLQKNSTSSTIWVQYIGYLVGNSEIEKAKMVVDRALKSIPPHMEADRLTVWGSLLQIEVLFGDEDSVKKTFSEALRTNDDYKISQEMANIYEKANKFQEADEIYTKLVKKYSLEKEVWIQAAWFNFRNKRLTAARKLLEKAYISLPKSNHVDLVNRFAQFEFKYGEHERGSTLFESSLSNFPKRLDIWLVYADSLIKVEDFVGARNVYERLLNMKLKIQQMKTVFNKFLEFEKKHGDAHTVSVIKTRVQDYVDATLKQHE